MKKKPKKRAALKARAPSKLTINLECLSLPKLGELCAGQGGRFFGLVAGDAGKPDYLIFAAEGEHPKLDHKAAGAHVAELAIGEHRDFALPSRADLRVMWANGRSLFKTDEAYWSAEQRAGGPDCAWCQYFYGYQGWVHKANKLRVVAVRRVPIHQFLAVRLGK